MTRGRPKLPAKLKRCLAMLASGVSNTRRSSSSSSAETGPGTLLLSPDFPPAPGGIQLLVSRVAAELPGRVRVVTLGQAGAGSYDATANVDVRRVARKGARLNKLAVAILNAAALRHAATFRPSVVISAHVTMAPAASWCRRWLGCPFLQYVHADEFRHRPRLTEFAVRNADAVIAVSTHARDMAVAFGADPSAVTIVYPGVDVPAITTASRPPGDPTLITVGRLVQAYKGHDVVLRAMPLILRKVPEARWIVIGDGPLRPSLEEMAHELGVEGAVSFLGLTSDDQRNRWLDRSHVFVMPSRLPDSGVGGEGFGIVYLEAGAHGLPVVAGAVAGALDAVVPAETGLLVDPNDPNAVAEGVAEMLSDRSQAAAFGEAGIKRARHLSWDRHARGVGSVIDSLVRA